MTDDDKALVERLGAQKNNQLNAIEALARIEAQAAEIERLEREVQKQRSLRDQYRAAWEAEKARAALGQTE